MSELDNTKSLYRFGNTTYVYVLCRSSWPFSLSLRDCDGVSDKRPVCLLFLFPSFLPAMMALKDAAATDDRVSEEASDGVRRDSSWR